MDLSLRSEFFDTDSGWIFHYDLGWLSENSGEEGDWYWSENKGWIWTKESIYPYFFSDNTEDWIFYDSDNLLTYDYSTRQWTPWDDLRLEYKSKEKKLEQAIGSAGNTDQAIENILNSNLSDNEKIDGIADMILFGI